MASMVQSPTYDYDLNNFGVGFFVSLSLLNLLESFLRVLRKPQRMPAIQLLASLMQTVLIITFMIQFLYTEYSCPAFTYGEGALYLVFQLTSTGIVIYKSTALIANESQRRIARIGLSFLLALALFLLIMSIVYVTMIPYPLNTCGALFQKTWNDAGKIVLVVIYIISAAAFAYPLLSHMKKSKGTLDRTGTQDVLLSVLTSVTAKLVLAILTYLITAAISLAGGFGNLYVIEFVLQNYSGIVASSLFADNDNRNFGSTTHSANMMKSPVAGRYTMAKEMVSNAVPEVLTESRV